MGKSGETSDRVRFANIRKSLPKLPSSELHFKVIYHPFRLSRPCFITPSGFHSENIFPNDSKRDSETIPFAHLITTAHYEYTNGKIRGNKRQSSKLRTFVNLYEIPSSELHSKVIYHPFDRPSQLPLPLLAATVVLPNNRKVLCENSFCSILTLNTPRAISIFLLFNFLIENIFLVDSERARETIPFAHLITTAHYENTNGEIRGNKRQSSKLRDSYISPKCPSSELHFKAIYHPSRPPLPATQPHSGCHSGTA
ncbi:hypothetical protein CDAR_618041 [Caerostris darwini]|uniref:Uncharacterized protein n=1 Tax=Caerostris darwini TaxID=1538125 RepID=A0AAV4U8V3_9ARAC|nr:hypothetical protein CDAR_618041 [Caerostris darwini]